MRRHVSYSMLLILLATIAVGCSDGSDEARGRGEWEVLPPPEPSLAVMYRESQLVVVGEVLGYDEIPLGEDHQSRIWTVSVSEVVKRDDRFQLPGNTPPPATDVEADGEFLVIVGPDDPFGDVEERKVEPGQVYVLFLNSTDVQGVAAPAGDRRFALGWTQPVERQLDRLQEYLQGDYPPAWQWQIPDDAEERTVPAKRRARAAQYLLNGELVGRRLWYESGELSFERPMRLGEPHGPVRSFDRSGQVRQLWYYRDGELHGYVQEWSPAGEVTDVLFYLGGRPVDETTYADALDNDSSLPPIPESASKESE